MKKSTKNINIEIEYALWKKLKIISVDKEITLGEVVSEILEKHLSKKSFSSEDK